MNLFLEFLAAAALESWFRRNPTGIADPWMPADDVIQEFMVATTPQYLYEASKDLYRERCTAEVDEMTLKGCLA